MTKSYHQGGGEIKQHSLWFFWFSKELGSAYFLIIISLHFKWGSNKNFSHKEGTMRNIRKECAEKFMKLAQDLFFCQFLESPFLGHFMIVNRCLSTREYSTKPWFYTQQCDHSWNLVIWPWQLHFSIARGQNVCWRITLNLVAGTAP